MCIESVCIDNKEEENIDTEYESDPDKDSDSGEEKHSSLVQEYTPF